MTRLLHCCVAALCVIAACVSLGASAAVPSCALTQSAPLYTFIGGGFHMQLAVEFPIAAQHVALSFDLPKSFFIDEAEAEQLYRMEAISAAQDTQGTHAAVLQDTTAAYKPLKMTSQHFFDIEAPVFKVNYTTNHVELSFEHQSDSAVLDAYLSESANRVSGVKARLVIPIHSRYDTLDTTTKFSLKAFVLGESAYVQRCLPSIALKGTADARCSGTSFSSKATEEMLRAQPTYQACLDLPVGVLDDLPYVYRALMALLVAGAVIVIVAIR